MRSRRASLAPALVGLFGWLLVGQARAAGSAPEPIAVIVGANLGGSDDDPLRYAESDARRFRALLVELGSLPPARAQLVVGGGAPAILRALAEARARAAELVAAGKRVTFFFYYSGHGDEESLHLARGPLALGALREAISSVPAAVRVTILDACRTGRDKGVSRGPAFALSLPEAPQGSVELRAAALGEPAQESEELGGSVFTHFVLSGLRGAADRDGDGRVTLWELYDYAYARVLRRTSAGEALQHPTLDVRLSGAGEVVLSEPALASASLELPGGAERYLVFAQPSDVVVGQLDGAAPSRIALPRGRFLVVRRAGERTGAAQVDLSLGGQGRLAPRDFRPISQEEWAARGGHLELRPNQLRAAVGAELAPGSADSAALRASLRYTRSRGHFQYGLEVAYLFGTAADSGYRASLQSLAGGPFAGARLFAGRLVVGITCGLDLRYSWQHLNGYSQPQLPGAVDNSFGSFGPRTGLQLLVPLGDNAAAELGLEGAALFRRERESIYSESQVTFHPVISLTIGLSYSI